MNDGQNLFDPATSFINAEWQIDEIADSLIRSRLIEPLIIVGIYNTKRRDLEYSDTEKGELYSHFILQTLKPFIDSTYRTLPEREYTSIGGSSLGGLASFLIAWNFSDHISKVACFSPAFKYKEFDNTLNVTHYEGPKKDLDFFIYNGGLGVDSILQEGVDLMITALLEQGFRKNENLFVKIDSSAGHSEKAWAKYTPDFLKAFYTKMAGTDSSYSNDNSKGGKKHLQH
jgi:predicted alpha/beta superfamily hydrolase